MARMDSRKQNLSIIWSGIALILVLLSSAVYARDQGPSDSFTVEALNYIRHFAFPKPMKAPPDEVLFEHPVTRVAQPASNSAPPSDTATSPPGAESDSTPPPPAEDKKE